MGWSVGFDSNWNRDIGYGVPSICDKPGCGAEIDRGLSYVCNDYQPYGGANGCGLFFCPKHQHARCRHKITTPTPDTPEWIKHKLAHKSWKQWRAEHPDEVEKLTEATNGSG